VVGKSIRLAGELKDTPVVGLVENMSSYVCTHCGKEESLFPGGNIEQMAGAAGIPYLGRIPFDSRIAVAADDGSLFMTRFGETPAGQAIQEVAGKLKLFLDGGTE
jgi:ATP-binding protein involved in chromosome partitioning